jgi:hypothetical protein
LNSTCRDLSAHGVLMIITDGVSSTLPPAILTG